MAFHDVRFPDTIAAGATGGAAFSTIIQETTGGREVRIGNWSTPRHRWNVGTGLRDEAGVHELIAFFRARAGRLHSWRFKAWDDYQGTGEAIGTGDGSTTAFQLRKTYTSGGVSSVRTITRPVVGTVAVRVAGVTAGFTLGALGVVTLTSAAANGAAVVADFEFDTPCRFDTDELNINLEQVDIGSWPEIPIVEVRE